MDEQGQEVGVNDLGRERLIVKVVTNAAGVMTGLAAPRAWTPAKADGVYAYGSGTNAVGLTIGLARATGVMKGSFKWSYDIRLILDE